MSKNTSRRHFIQSSLLAAITLPLLGYFRPAWAEKKDDTALPTGEKPVSDTDPIVVAIGYKADVAKIDFAKYPNRKKPEAKNQFCKNCALYLPSNKGWGKCQMITSGLVKAEGWCGSWSQKA